MAAEEAALEQEEERRDWGSPGWELAARLLFLFLFLLVVVFVLVFWLWFFCLRREKSTMTTKKRRPTLSVSFSSVVSVFLLLLLVVVFLFFLSLVVHRVQVLFCVFAVEEAIVMMMLALVCLEEKCECQDVVVFLLLVLDSLK